MASRAHSRNKSVSVRTADHAKRTFQKDYRQSIVELEKTLLVFLPVKLYCRGQAKASMLVVMSRG
jgi:hypothetical protein